MANRLEERLLGGGQQALRFQRNVARGNGGGVVADEAAFDDADIDLDDVAGQDLARSADAVNHFLVDGDAGIAGKPAVVEKGAPAVVLAHQLRRKLVDLAGGAAGNDLLGEGLEDGGGDRAGGAHEFDLARRFDGDADFAGHFWDGRWIWGRRER